MADFTSLSVLGDFEIYIPEVFPPNAPNNAIFMRRVSDGLDWYEGFAHYGSAFAETDVLVSALALRDGSFLTQCVLRALEVGRMPVIPQRILVLKGVDPDFEPVHKLFEQKIYDPVAGTLSDPPPLVVQVITSKKEMWSRMTDDEAATLDAVMSQAPAKLRNIFIAAQYIDHADELYGQLRATIAAALNQSNPNYARADEILAPT